jgi:trans-aconitate methyltransferase
MIVYYSNIHLFAIRQPFLYASRTHDEVEAVADWAEQYVKFEDELARMARDLLTHVLATEPGQVFFIPVTQQN